MLPKEKEEGRSDETNETDKAAATAPPPLPRSRFKPVMWLLLLLFLGKGVRRREEEVEAEAVGDKVARVVAPEEEEGREVSSRLSKEEDMKNSERSAPVKASSS